MGEPSDRTSAASVLTNTVPIDPDLTPVEPNADTVVSDPARIVSMERGTMTPNEPAPNSCIGSDTFTICASADTSPIDSVSIDPDPVMPASTVPTNPVPVDPAPTVHANPDPSDVANDPAHITLTSTVPNEPVPVDHISVDPIPTNTVLVDPVHVDPVSIVAVDSNLITVIIIFAFFMLFGHQTHSPSHQNHWSIHLDHTRIFAVF